MIHNVWTILTGGLPQAGMNWCSCAIVRHTRDRTGAVQWFETFVGCARAPQRDHPSARNRHRRWVQATFPANGLETPPRVLDVRRPSADLGTVWSARPQYAR